MPHSIEPGGGQGALEGLSGVNEAEGVSSQRTEIILSQSRHKLPWGGASKSKVEFWLSSVRSTKPQGRDQRQAGCGEGDEAAGVLAGWPATRVEEARRDHRQVHQSAGVVTFASYAFALRGARSTDLGFESLSRVP